MLNILAIGLLAVIIRNPNMMEAGYDAGESLPTPLSNIDSYTTPTPPETYYRDHSLNYRKSYNYLHFLLNLRKPIFINSQKTLIWEASYVCS